MSLYKPCGRCAQARADGAFDEAASCPFCKGKGFPGASYTSRVRSNAIRSLRAHILREHLAQMETGNAPEWIITILPVVEGA